MTPPELQENSAAPHGHGGGASGLVRHGAGFVAAGLLSLAVDMGVTSALTRGFDMSPYPARVLAIACAVVTAWQAHRRLTFALKTPSTLAEFIKFAGVASATAVTNYLLYAAVLIYWPGTAPEVALILACFGSMIVTYVGIRYGVFKKL